MNRYEQRRRRVLDQLQFGEMMVLYSGESVACSMDEGFDFEANHHFFYLTGLRRENMALVLANTHCPAHVILFIEEPIPDMERWTGRRVTIDEARAVSGIDDVRYIDNVDSLISRCIARETVEAAYFDCYRNAMGDVDSYNMPDDRRHAHGQGRGRSQDLGARNYRYGSGLAPRARDARTGSHGISAAGGI